VRLTLKGLFLAAAMLTLGLGTGALVAATATSAMAAHSPPSE
jgi:hypothetical protein